MHRGHSPALWGTTEQRWGGLGRLAQLGRQVGICKVSQHLGRSPHRSTRGFFSPWWFGLNYWLPHSSQHGRTAQSVPSSCNQCGAGTCCLCGFAAFSSGHEACGSTAGAAGGTGAPRRQALGSTAGQRQAGGSWGLQISSPTCPRTLILAGLGPALALALTQLRKLRPPPIGNAHAPIHSPPH